ncbi:MAG: DNA polymerase III subunit gamma/tau [Gammaproteobacteria bacterium]|nr:DNA polymerase III subunit gamma/tau [Gammaproteobacteria bacterium]
MSYLVLARKWRPRTFSELVGQEPVVQALRYALTEGRLHHAYLFSGIRGVGKTTVARILAKALNCECGIVADPCGRCAACQEIDSGRFIDLIEVDAASRTKVDDTRELLDNVQYAPTRGRFKVYLIDEVHMLSAHSFNALLKTLEEPPPHVKFILATTDPQRLPVTVLSRCLKFTLRRLADTQIADQLRHILEAEGLAFEEPALAALAHAADGSLRDALSLTDQALATGGGRVGVDAVHGMLGLIAPDFVRRLIEALARADAPGMMAIADEAYTLGFGMEMLLDELLRALHELALAKADCPVPDEWMPVVAAGAPLAADEIQLYYEIGCLGRRQLPLAPDPRTGTKMTLLRMLAFKPAETAAETPGKPVVAAGKVATARREGRQEAVTAPVPRAVAPAADPEPAVAPPAAGGGAQPAEDGAAVLEALSLTGLMRHLAQNAVLTRTGDVVSLGVDPGVAHLLNEERVRVLRDALSAYYGRPMALSVTTGASVAGTPANLRRQAEERAMQDAITALQGDPAVEALQREFNARVHEESVRPLRS